MAHHQIANYRFTSADGTVINGRVAFLKHVGYIGSYTLNSKLMKQKPSGSFTWQDTTWSYEPIYNKVPTPKIGPQPKRGRPIGSFTKPQKAPKAKIIIEKAAPGPQPKQMPKPYKKMYQLTDRKTGAIVHRLELTFSAFHDLMHTRSVAW